MLQKVEMTEGPVKDTLLQALEKEYDHVIIVGVKGMDVFVRASGGLSYISCVGQLEVAKQVFFEVMDK